MKSAKPDGIQDDQFRAVIESENAQNTFVFAHLSDPHLSSLEGVRKRDLFNQRLLGYISWRSRRRAEHLPTVLAAMVRDLQQIRPEHIVVTGDLTHLGLPREFQEVSQWLHDLGPPFQVTVIPGNHDAYIRAPWDNTFALWAPYMVSDPAYAPPLEAWNNRTLFPSLRIRGPVAFIGLSTARPSPPFFATGNLGRPQLRLLEELLEETARRDLLRVLLIHHPPLPGTEKWRKRLTDSRALYSILRKHGVELLLYGHTHRPALAQLQTVSGIAPVIGVPSASAIGRKPGRHAQYNLYRLTRHDQAWNLQIFVRGYSPTKGSFIPEGERELTLRHLGQ